MVRVTLSTGRGHTVFDDAWFHRLHELPAEVRRPVAERVAARMAELPPDRGLVEVGFDPATALTLLSHGLADDRFAAARDWLLRSVGNRFVFHGLWGVEALFTADAAAGLPVPPAVLAALRRTALGGYAPASTHAALKRLTDPPLNVGEAWSDAALAAVTGPDDPWLALLRHLTTATTAKPSAAWEQTARALADAAGPERVRDLAVALLRQVGHPRTLPLAVGPYRTANDLFDAHNATPLRGLAWLASLLPPHQDTARTLGALVETSLRKVPGVGPRSPKVANAGVVALSRIDGEAALAELARLAARVTYRATAKLVDSVLLARAAALGLGREEVEELAVPTYGLTTVGSAAVPLGEATALLTVGGVKATLTWRTVAGKQVKGVPAAVRRDHPEEVAELRASVKDLDGMLAAQRDRLDRQFLARRTWAYGSWRERLLDHPLVGTLARRLLWTVDGTAVGFADGALRTLDDTPVTPPQDAGITLWHPADRDPAETAAWREWLERHAVTQPFKQAHREVYLLTDAERATGTYSNRFAAHVLRQHQFHALAAVRGWRNRLRLSVDDTLPPAVRELPAWGLRAEYWIHGDAADSGADDSGVHDITDSGSFLRLRTDQVRFYPLDAPENLAHCDGHWPYEMWLRDGSEPVDPLPLEEIPPLVLSEVLRDVDLFVGVASVGNDPTWQDGGPDGRHREYWTSYGFGELNATAQTRRALLERLVPRLAIADRCTLDGRFLLVKGDRHTYRIHLGSGNVLLSPSDRYLCIVPKSAGTAQPAGYLPYEGDHTLAVILSKAMLLARDTEITDRTILSQLQPRGDAERARSQRVAAETPHEIPQDAT
ncbi:DUF4132 domain-containing protein [Streptomyces hainanensis]|uniref:DUF4132 domain-containing protein n=2 Tax=Streptomyces hainanensis TaxID=402648 RepID=A0A4R4TIW7_9ACTN|nr:DUF4132 domain-containing protein [Streptomyces hainanensis]